MKTNLNGDAIAVICMVLQIILFIPFLYVALKTDNATLVFVLLVPIVILAIPAQVNQYRKRKND